MFQKSGQLVTHPDIQSGWWSDLYIVPSQYLPARQAEPGVLQMMQEQPQEIGGYRLTFQTFELPNREAITRGEGPMVVEAVMNVVASDGTTATVKPALRIESGTSVISEPVALPGGATATLTRVDPTTGMAVVQLGGVDLTTINPDDLKMRAFVEVSVEPGIKLVWAAIIISVLGGLLALVRRWREARPAANAQPTPLPTTDAPRERPVLHPGVAAITQTHSEVH